MTSKDKSEKINESIQIVQFVSIMIVIVAGISYIGIGNLQTIRHNLLDVVHFFIPLSAILLIAWLCLEKIFIKEQTNEASGLFSFSLNAFLFVLVALSINLTGQEASRLEFFLFLPVVVAAISHGWFQGGLPFAAISSLFLISYHYPAAVIAQDLLALDTSTMYMVALFGVGWLTGNFAEYAKSEYQEKVKLQELIERKDAELARFSCGLQDLSIEEDLSTGFVRYEFFNYTLEKMLTEEAASQGKKRYLIFGQLDNFAGYNDVHGYMKGNEALQMVKEVILTYLPPKTTVTWYTKDGFAMVLPSYHQGFIVDYTETLGDKIRELNLQFMGETLTVSMGIAKFPENGMSISNLIYAATDALYDAKNIEENSIRFYNSTFDGLIARAKQDMENQGENFGKTVEKIKKMKCFLGSINNKDRFTYAHSERVTSLVCDMAAALKLSEKEIEVLKHSAHFHDIGKAFPNTGYLCDYVGLCEQKADPTVHAVVGANLIHNLAPILSECVPIVRHHHDDFNENTEIPLGARILRIVDEYDIMTSRLDFLWNQALEKLEEDSETLYDPELVPVFVKMIREKRKELIKQKLH